METPRKESDQLPEEAPAEQVEDDSDDDAGRGEDDRQPDDQATGHPPNAG